MLPEFANKAVFKMALIMILFSLFISCKKDCLENHNATVPFNLNVLLHGGKDANGFIEFRQNQNHIINLDTWVFNLEPNRSYLLQRAVDSLDNNCTSVAWLTLGKGLQPQAIVTDSKGNGAAQLFRDVSAIPSGSKFDIHFQVLDEADSTVVLKSDCYQYMVK